MKKLLPIFGLLCLCQGLFSAQNIKIDQTVVIPINLSSRAHNRIGILGDRVKKAFYKGTNVLVEVEEETGQLFVQSIRPNCPNSTLSIVSVSGVVQDLELSFLDIPSEIVILNHRDEVIFPENGIEIEEAVYPTVEQASLMSLIEGVIKGVIPQGYFSIEDQDTPQLVVEGIMMQRINRLVSNDQIVFIFRLKNTSRKTRTVTECKVNVLDGDWVFLDRNQLKPEECAVVLIGCMR